MKLSACLGHKFEIVKTDLVHECEIVMADLVHMCEIVNAMCTASVSLLYKCTSYL